MNTLIIMITAAIASLVTLIILFFRKKRIEKNKQNKSNIIEEESAVKDRGRVVPMPEVNWHQISKEAIIPTRDMSMSEFMQEIRRTLPTEYTKELPNIQGKSGMDGRPIKVKTMVNPQLDRMKALMGKMGELEDLTKLYE